MKDREEVEVELDAATLESNNCEPTEAALKLHEKDKDKNNVLPSNGCDFRVYLTYQTASARRLHF